MRKASAMLAASLPPTGPGTSTGSRWRRSWQAANTSSISAVRRRRRGIAHGLDHAQQATLADLEHVDFVVVVVAVVAEAAMAQAEPRGAQYGGLERTRIVAGAGARRRCRLATRPGRRRVEQQPRADATSGKARSRGIRGIELE